MAKYLKHVSHLGHLGRIANSLRNLFYAIVVSTLSEAKMEEDAKQRKKWAVLSDRFLVLFFLFFFFFGGGPY